MINSLGFVCRFGVHAPSLPEIPQKCYLKVRKVGCFINAQSCLDKPIKKFVSLETRSSKEVDILHEERNICLLAQG